MHVCGVRMCVCPLDLPRPQSRWHQTTAAGPPDSSAPQSWCILESPADMRTELIRSRSYLQQCGKKLLKVFLKMCIKLKKKKPILISDRLNHRCMKQIKIAENHRDGGGSKEGGGDVFWVQISVKLQNHGLFSPSLVTTLKSYLQDLKNCHCYSL